MHDSISLSPYFRFSLRFCMSPGEIHGPRITYIQSFNLIESGEGKLYTENGTVDLHTGVHIYMAAGKKHTWEASRNNPFVYRIVFFEWNYRDRPGVLYPSDYISDPGSTLIREHIEPPIPFAFPEVIVVEDMEEWIRLFTPIHSNYDVYDRNRFPGSLRIQGDFLMFLDHVLNHAMQPKSYVDRLVKKFIQAVEEETPDLMQGNIEQWTRCNGISRSHFHQLFKQQIGKTPNAFRTGQQIKRTFRDLIETTETITAIAVKHRFESVHYYSKLFHKVTGLTPGEFRRRNRIY